MRWAKCWRQPGSLKGKQAVKMGQSSLTRPGKCHREPWWVCTGRLNQDKAKVWVLEWDHRLWSIVSELFDMAFVHVNEQTRDSFQQAEWNKPLSTVGERAWIHESSLTASCQIVFTARNGPWSTLFTSIDLVTDSGFVSHYKWLLLGAICESTQSKINKLI